MRQQRGQQHREPGLPQPEASEDITFACGKTSGEGLGQNLDPLASFQRGRAKSGLTGSSSFFGTVWRRTCSRELHFPAAVGPFGLWGAGGGGRAGQRFLEPSLLHRGYALENPRRISLEDPLAGSKAKPMNEHRPSHFLLKAASFTPASSLDLLFPGSGQDSRVGGGEWLSPVSGGRGVSTASFVWVWPLPGRDHAPPGAEQSLPEEQ